MYLIAIFLLFGLIGLANLISWYCARRADRATRVLQDRCRREGLFCWARGLDRTRDEFGLTAPILPENRRDVSQEDWAIIADWFRRIGWDAQHIRDSYFNVQS